MKMYQDEKTQNLQMIILFREVFTSVKHLSVWAYDLDTVMKV